MNFFIFFLIFFISSIFPCRFLVLSILTLTLISTYCDYYEKNSKFYLKEFSLIENLKNLFKNDANAINCIDGLKGISLLLLIFAHCFISKIVIDYGENYLKELRLMNRTVLLNCTFLPVETLFTISGFLSVKSWRKQMEK